MGKQEDQLFAKMAIENYFIQKKQAIECVEILKNLDKEGKPLPSLSELLIEKGYLTLLQKNTILRMITAQQSPVVVATSSERVQKSLKERRKRVTILYQKGKRKLLNLLFRQKN
jgi:hypothetical protein